MKNVIFFNSKQFGIIPGVEKSGGQERIHGEGSDMATTPPLLRTLHNICDGDGHI